MGCCDWRALAAAFVAALSLPAAAQVQSVVLSKDAGYLQGSPTDIRLDPANNNWGFSADVNGQGIAGIAAPRVAGPFNVQAIGSGHNGGFLVYSAGDSGWRYGTHGDDWGSPSKANLDALFPDGTYTFTVNGASIPLNLKGDAYPNVPVMDLSGGQWASGAYEINPSVPLTITTNAFTAYGTHVDDLICIAIIGPGYPLPFASVAPFGCEWGLAHQFASQVPGSKQLSVTIPANKLQPGQEYLIGAVFSTIVDSNPVAALPGSRNVAGYALRTFSRVKTTVPVFPMTVTSNITPTVSSASAQIQFRPQDVGTQGSVYVFAMAPVDKVVNPVKSGGLVWKIQPTPKDIPVECVLAQLSASGQLTGVSASTLQAYVTGVLSSQGAAVTILNGVATVSIGGSTFFVGYGATGASMLNNGINRAAVTIPGAQVCQPQSPQTGWWWNALEDGRGFSVEKHGNNMFFASFLYDVSGRSTWYVSTGPTSLEGSLYVGDLLAASGGQTLGGSYPGFPSLSKAGTVTLTFNSATNGAMVWPGGTVPIQRLAFVPNGLSLPAYAGQPEGGWWWSAQESGRGFFMEWQGDWLDVAGYMYDDSGNPVWYLTVAQMSGADRRTFSGNWWSFANGQTLTGPWKPNSRASDHVAPVTITFTGADAALLTLPNGRTASLTRQRF